MGYARSKGERHFLAFEKTRTNAQDFKDELIGQARIAVFEEYSASQFAYDQGKRC